MEIKPVKVVRVTKTEFEIEDGRVYEHPVELDEVPTIEEFQKIYDEWVVKFKDMFGKKENKMSQAILKQNLRTIEQIREILNFQRSEVQEQLINACIDIPPIEPMETIDFLDKQIEYSSEDDVFCVYWIQWHKIDGSRLVVSTLPDHKELSIPNYQKIIESQWFRKNDNKLIPLAMCCICGGAEGYCHHTSTLNNNLRGKNKNYIHLDDSCFENQNE